MRLLWICGAALLALMTASRAWMEPAHPGLLVALLLAFVPYSLAVWRVPSLEWKTARWIILLVALLARGVMLTSPLVLSNDVHRYHWEGTVQNAGWNPYRYAPAAAELTGLRDTHWAKLDHREVPSAYPPLLLAVFRLGAGLSEEVAVFKWLFGFADLATLALLVGWLRARGQPPALAIIWAWSPLVIVEFAGMAHAMSLAIGWFVAGLWALERSRYLVAGAALAAAVLAHLLALPLMLAVVLACRMWQPRFWGSVIVVSGLVSWPYVDAGRDLLIGLTHFGARWEFNGSVFPLVKSLIGDSVPARLASEVWLADFPAKLVMAGLLVGVISWTIIRRYPPGRTALAVAAAVLLLSPTVHPWYVTWLVALCCVEFRPAWFLFGGTVLISYIAKITQLETGLWTDSVVVRWLEYLPVLAWWLTSLTGRAAPGTMTSVGKTCSS